MAKRKLSPKQRQAIRKEIQDLLSKKKRPIEILKAVAKKYGISTITGRWYLKSVRDALTIAAPRGNPNKGLKRAASKKSHKQTQQNNGALHRLVSNFQMIAQHTFSRARQAKKLVPQWRAYLSKEISLRKIEAKVKRELLIVSSKAQALHQKIRTLTSR